MVLPDGRIWDGLRGLRKDNTGYDMKQLFIGAEGHAGDHHGRGAAPVSEADRHETAWIAVDSPGAAWRCWARASPLGETMSAFELIGRRIVDFLLAGVPGHEDPMREAHPWYVLLNVASQGPPGSLLGPLSDTLADASDRGLLRDALIATSSAQAARLWKIRESLVEAQVAAGGTIAHDVSVPVSRIAEFLGRADAALGRPIPASDPVPSVTSATATSTITQYGRRLGRHRYRQQRANINRIVHDIVADLGGSISAEHGIGRSRLAELEHYKAATELEMMRAVKQALDPKAL